MRSRVFLAIVVGGAAVVSIAGCTTSGSATPQSSSTTPPATSTAPASQIADPLNVDKLAGDICSALTDAQLQPYTGALSGKDPSSQDNGKLCSFRPSDALGSGVGAAVVNIASPSEDLLYQSHAMFPWRQKISPIAGYPALDSSTSHDPTDPANGGDCSTSVAINDKQYISVDFSAVSPSTPNFTKPCTASEALAAAMVQNIKTGGS